MLGRTVPGLTQCGMIRAFLIFLLFSIPATADEMTFFMKNDHPRAVVVELFGQDTGKQWPGNDKVYLLEKGGRKSVTVDCSEGERICYGAWVNGDDRTFWGVGPDNDRACETCCSICVGKTTEPVAIQ